MNIGEKIKNARKDKGLTQTELGEKIGLSKYAIAKYEQGQREPKLDIVTKLIDELGLDFWELNPAMDTEIEAVGPYEEDIKFADDVIKRKEEKQVLGQLKRSMKSMHPKKDLSTGLSHEIELDIYKKVAQLEETVDDVDKFNDLTAEFFEELREAVSFTVKLKLNEFEYKVSKK